MGTAVAWRVRKAFAPQLPCPYCGFGRTGAIKGSCTRYDDRSVLKKLAATTRRANLPMRNTMLNPDSWKAKAEAARQHNKASTANDGFAQHDNSFQISGHLADDHTEHTNYKIRN